MFNDKNECLKWEDEEKSLFILCVKIYTLNSK